MSRIKSVDDIKFNKKGIARVVIRFSKDSPADLELSRRLNRYCLNNNFTSKGAGLIALLKLGLKSAGY